MSMSDNQEKLLMGLTKDGTEVYIVDFCKSDFTLLLKGDPERNKSIIYNDQSCADES